MPPQFWFFTGMRGDSSDSASFVSWKKTIVLSVCLLNEFNFRLKLRTGLLLTVWESSLRVVQRHAIAILILRGEDPCIIELKLFFAITIYVIFFMLTLKSSSWITLLPFETLQMYFSSVFFTFISKVMILGLQGSWAYSLIYPRRVIRPLTHTHTRLAYCTCLLVNRRGSLATQIIAS